MIRENICYDDFVRERPYDAAQLDEMVELMVEAVCSRKEMIRVAGNEFPQTVVKSQLLKLDGQHIRFVFDCHRENTTQARNVKQYLMTVLYNAPVIIENHYVAQVKPYVGALPCETGCPRPMQRLQPGSRTDWGMAQRRRCLPSLRLGADDEIQQETRIFMGSCYRFSSRQ